MGLGHLWVELRRTLMYFTRLGSHSVERPKQSSSLDVPTSCGASGMGFSLLLDGWFVNDPFVVTFFATGTRRTYESRLKRRDKQRAA